MNKLISKARTLLSLNDKFTFDELKAAYRTAALRSHPDRGGDTKMMQSINESFVLLSKHCVASHDGLSDYHKMLHENLEGHALHDSGLPAFDSLRTLLRKTYNIIDDDATLDNLHDVSASKRGGIYFKCDERHFELRSVYGDWKRFSVEEVTHGGKSARQAAKEHIKTYRFSFEAQRFPDDYSENSHLISNSLADWLGSDCSFPELYDVMSSLIEDESNETEYKGALLTVEEGFRPYINIEFQGHRLSVQVSEPKIEEVFNPFTITERYQPLKKVPLKMTRPLLLRALFNGQFHSLQCSFSFSDDYQYDASIGFEKGYIENPLEIARDWFEKMAGRGKISIDNSTCRFKQHSNESYWLKLSIDNRYPAFDLNGDQTLIGELKKIA
ncbi:hypothetical protein [Vibrio mediterranei]|uniref:hypothetical protein n=1 Tax=Vibrio mediterranei TaxID=689 RepID=UPI0040695E82